MSGINHSPDGKIVLGEIEVGDDAFVGEITGEKSVVIPGWIMAHPELSDRAIRLWGYMKGAINGSFVIPGTSHRSLAALLDVSERTARSAIYELRDAGAIAIKPRFKNGKQLKNVYFLWPAVPSDDTPTRVATSNQHGSTLPPVYINSNSNIDTAQDSVATPKTSGKRRSVVNYSEDFESVWAIYPRRINKGGAFRSFQTTMRRGATVEQLLTATRNYAAERIGKDESYTLHGATFFGPNERWRDFLNDKEAKVKVELSTDELISALIYDDWDAEGCWDTPDGPCYDNPTKHGYNRPKNHNGQLVDAKGEPYVLDAQGKRRQVGYWN